MRYFTGFIFVLAVGVMGCGEDQCAAACAYYGDDEGHIFVQMGPSVTSTYDVDLELDGAAGAFTCERVEGGWVATSQTGSGKALADCAGYGFTIFEQASFDAHTLEGDASTLSPPCETITYVRFGHPRCWGSSV